MQLRYALSWCRSCFDHCHRSACSNRAAVQLRSVHMCRSDNSKAMFVSRQALQVEFVNFLTKAEQCKVQEASRSTKACRSQLEELTKSQHVLQGALLLPALLWQSAAMFQVKQLPQWRQCDLLPFLGLCQCHVLAAALARGKPHCCQQPHHLQPRAACPACGLCRHHHRLCRLWMQHARGHGAM
jgi:hypothetical protein